MSSNRTQDNESNSQERVVLLACHKQGKSFVFFATLLAFIVSGFFLYTSFRNYNSITLPHAESFENARQVFGLVAFILLSIMLVIIVIVKGNNKHRYRELEVDLKAGLLFLRKHKASKPFILPCSEITTLYVDADEFDDQFIETASNKAERHHDLIFEKLRRKYFLECPSKEKALEIFARIKPLCSFE